MPTTPPSPPCRPPEDDPASLRQTTSTPFSASLPAPDQTALDVEQVQDASHAVIDEIVYGLRPAVEGGNRRRDDGAHFRGLQQQAAMPQVERGLARHQHQPAALLEH